jgi:hypothetical protein
MFYWKWNGNNLYGYKKSDNEQKFTWQSGGQQFTIFEKVPDQRLILKVKKPDIVPKDFVFEKIGFSKDWITVTHTV